MKGVRLPWDNPPPPTGLCREVNTPSPAYPPASQGKRSWTRSFRKSSVTAWFLSMENPRGRQPSLMHVPKSRKEMG